ncbi:hypothetical protein IDH44_14275 [Paenibacillus sp. IB182496]|uniref:Uncharacterized protein n=1 Tax=Paenibacillus sabuli TaxID=2772509 RepID=A0A927BU56_9BACL|nr:hypothetical protein [Paenibacillus sabuli]MBD2846367.1 hypothetical protein [Paenibacillus sabuli]
MVNVEQDPMSFANYTRISGSDRLVGATYRYTNVITKNGIQVDAIVTIEEMNSATLGAFDQSDPNATLHKRLNPQLSTSGEGTVRLKFAFINADTWDEGTLAGEPVFLKNFYLTAIDLDGSGGTSEFVEASGFASYTTDSATQLTIVPPGSGETHERTRFRGISGNLDGRDFENTAAVIMYYEYNVSSMEVVIGNTGTLSGRLFSINFGAPGGTFSNRSGRGQLHHGRHHSCRHGDRRVRLHDDASPGRGFAGYLCPDPDRAGAGGRGSRSGG